MFSRTSDSRYALTASNLVRHVATMLTRNQNRELQIMRIVRHPNIVQLKAFYYSNGERVRSQSTSCCRPTDFDTATEG